MSWHKQLKSLSEIPNLNFSGYLWASDESAPQTISKIKVEQYEQNGKPAHPFIREAYLFDTRTQISITIQHVPGRYLIHLFDLTQLPTEAQESEQKIIAHKKLGQKLIFKEIWLPEEDELNNWPVLTKKASVFCGIE